MSEKFTAGSGYAYGQLEKAMRLATNEAGARKVERWQAVLSGMADGTLSVGSRTPVAGTPAWVTLEVAHGGFATGGYLAESPLSDEERAVLRELPENAPGGTDRERLNLWYLTDAGQATLVEALAERTYRVDVPEHAALPAVAWLLANDRPEQALDLVAELRPWLHRLRMTPRFADRPAQAGEVVHVATVDEVRSRLRAVTVPAQLDRMLDTVRVWHPLYDRLVALWSSTVDGAVPALVDDRVVGGWPCTVWPDDWAERRAEWLADYERAATTASESRDQKGNFARLRAALLACEHDSSALTGRDVGWIRRAIANTVTRRGAAGSAERTALRESQRAELDRPTHAAIATELASRLDGYPGDGGVPELEPVVTADTPPSLVAKVARALAAPVEELVARKVITSGEVLARVLPQITSGLMAANIEDPDLAALYAQTYAAFRRRRSLLLLNLERQVGFEELPWIGVLAPLRTGTPSLATRRTLSQTVLLALHGFPQTILPNPLVSELRALAKQAKVDLPLVEEVAADIFMGTFTMKWRSAAEIASRVLAGTLYARYYDLPESWPAPRKERRWGRATASDFAELCGARAKEADGEGGGSVAKSGIMLEQSQILTTHNLAVLVDGLDLTDRLRAMAPDLAERTFEWVVRRQSRRYDDWHSRLIAVKNAAYAWRQAVFYLSFCDRATQEAIVAECWNRLETAGVTKLRPAASGLTSVLRGARFDENGRTQGGGRRLLGWSAGRHWAL